MKQLNKYFLLLIGLCSLVSCKNDDDVTVPPPRPYAEVYPEDLAKIETFLNTHYVEVDSDFNTTFFEIPENGSQTPISDMPELEFKEVNTHNLTYKIYYLKLREGVGENPTRVDSAFVSYKGNLISDISVTFDQRVNPIWFPLEDVIRGWGEIIPEFKTGTHTIEPNGSVNFEDFGVGVMFLPSGLGYYNTAVGNIPSYSPLIFNFKLYKLHFRDHDRDRILSKYEYGSNFNGLPIDTDGDGLPDYLDRDDDGDGYLTKDEIRKPLPLLVGQGTSLYYPYNPIDDDPSTTTVDETEPKGIPDASGDGTSPTRLRRHLDKNAKPPYTTY